MVINKYWYWMVALVFWIFLLFSNKISQIKKTNEVVDSQSDLKIQGNNLSKRSSVKKKVLNYKIQEEKVNPVENFHEIAKKNSIPNTKKIESVFFSQAPYGNWNYPYQEACEEASMLLAYYYIKDQNPTKSQFDKDLIEFINFEKKYLRYYESTDIQTTVDVFQSIYKNLDIKILMLYSISDLKNELIDGNVVVAPFNGKKLKNPYYTNGGPEYHMMLIKSYDDKGFFVNDVGTSRGKDYFYNTDVLRNSLGDLENNEKKVAVWIK